MNIVVYGFYHKNNIGDELFKEAFQQLFHSNNFTFIDHITISNIKDFDVVFIGGGSFLDSPLVIEEDALNLLKSKQIFYLGVVVEK